MKKYIIILIAIGFIFTACNPVDDIYTEIKDNEAPYSQSDVTYTLTSDDYASASAAAMETFVTEEDSVWASYIDVYQSFNAKYKINAFGPAILSNQFPILKEGSNVFVTYNQYIGDNYGDIEYLKIEDDDYTAMGGTIADTLCFTASSELSNIADYLATKLPDAANGTYAGVNYRYPNYDTEAAGFYKFNGTEWSEVENSLVLVAADYDSMGQDSGQPGKYNNFSSSTPPQNYLPQFLSLNYPYAQVDDEKLVVAKFYGYATSYYAISCKFNGEKWTLEFPGEETVSQFLYKDGSWKFDPTIRFTMSTDDYQIIVNADPYPDSYGTAGYYYGSSSHYNNFDVRLDKRQLYAPEIWPETLTEEEGNAMIWDHLHEGIILMLQAKYPDATPQVDGIDVHYFVTFDTYIGNYVHVWYTGEYICTSAGTPPTFELVEDVEVDAP